MSASSPRPSGPFVRLRVADLQSLTNQIELALDYVRHLDHSARLVIGGNLRTATLDRSRLERLQASVARQASDAKHVFECLDEATQKSALHNELRQLIEFLEDALVEIGQRLRQTH